MDTLMFIMLGALTFGILFGILPFLLNMIYEAIVLAVDYIKYK